MRFGRAAAVGATCGLLAVPVTARAQEGQDTPSLRRHHVALNGGLLLDGGYSIGDRAARLRGNGVGASAPPLTLFRADSSIERARAAEARVGYSLTAGISVEVGLAFARPSVVTRLSEDVEASPATLDAERLAQYVVDVGATWQLPRPVIGRRLRPFVTGGVGYLRQLYDERTLVETGRIYYGGAGVRYWLRGGTPGRRSLGLRGDARVTWRQGGVDFDGQTRAWPSASVMLFWEP